MLALGVLVPLPFRQPPPPEDQPLGRAALRLRDEGLEVVFGARATQGRLSGAVARPGGWEERTEVEVQAVFDRYPSRGNEAVHEALVSRFSHLPLANSLDRIRTCRDKLRTQEILEAAGVPMPAVVAEPSRFAEQLDAWKTGFLKPRYGAMGRGITRVQPGDPLPALGEGTVAGELEPLFLQQAVPPPEGWAGISVRVLAQREGAEWVLNPGVARRSRHDPIVAASRGAELACIDDWLPVEALAELHAVVEASARALATEGLVEVGIDVMIDQELRPWVIEANSRPWGRVRGLAALDSRFARAHELACERPLRWLASRASDPRSL